MKDRKRISRVLRTKEEAKTSYDRLSRWYDWLAGSSERKYKEKGLDCLHVTLGESVLEIGYGTGEMIQELAQKVGGSGQVAGIDLSTGMFKVAQDKLKKAGLSEVANLACADAARLPFSGNFFDAVYMSFTLELFDTPEIPVVLQECRRVLRPHGRIAVVAMAKREAGSLMVRLYEWAHANFERYADCRPIYLQTSLEDAGFRITGKTEMSMFGLPVDIVLANNDPEALLQPT